MQFLKRSFGLLMATLAIVLVVGCAQMGVPTPKTFNEKALAAEASVKTVLDSATLLRSAGKITSADVQSIIKGTDAAQEGINVARALQKTAPTTPAGANRLQLALDGLTLLQTYLATAGATP